MLQGDRGQLRNLFTTQQQDALAAWAKSLRSSGADRFLVTQSVAQSIGTGYQFLLFDFPLYDTQGVWDSSQQFLTLPNNSVWDLRLYVSSDTLVAGAQRTELFLRDAYLTAPGLNGRVVDFGYKEQVAGTFSPCFGAARHYQQVESAPRALRPVIRFSGGTVVPTIPGQGFTALSGERLA